MSPTERKKKPDLQSFVCRGRLTKDPERREAAKDDKHIVTFSLALTMFDGTTSFIDCEAWDAIASLVEKRCKKGCAVVFEGYVRQVRWQDTRTNINRSKIVFVAKNVQVVDVPRAVPSEDPNEPPPEFATPPPPAALPPPAPYTGPIPKKS